MLEVLGRRGLTAVELVPPGTHGRMNSILLNSMNVLASLLGVIRRSILAPSSPAGVQDRTDPRMRRTARK